MGENTTIKPLNEKKHPLSTAAVEALVSRIQDLEAEVARLFDTQAIQKEVIANRSRRGWSSATDISKTTEGIADELGEFTKARRKQDREGMIDGLGDIMVWCLGGMEILGVDAGQVITKIVETNAGRVYACPTDHY